MFRLHIDVPMGHDDEKAIEKSNKFIQYIHDAIAFYANECVDGDEVVVGYRLGHDEERQKSNHLDKNENGHVTKKKNKLVFNEQSE